MRHVGVRLGINVLYPTFFHILSYLEHFPPHEKLIIFTENSAKIILFSPSLSPKLTDTVWQADGQDDVLSQACRSD